MADSELAAMLSDSGVSIHVLYAGGEPAGFYELDQRHRPDVNINYFGLMRHAIGKGMGSALLRSAIDMAWEQGTRGITVNTCTADHPRALPTYLRAGFRPIRETRELWAVPTRLGLRIPGSLRA
jgi:GNAT superfamily N-acetyltransferase